MTAPLAEFRLAQPSTVKEAIAVGAQGLDLNVVIGEGAVEIAGAAAVQHVDDKFAFGFAENIKADKFFDALEIDFAQIHDFAPAVLAEVGRRGVCERLGMLFFDYFSDARFNVFGDFRESGAGVGGRKF